ncbi:hypothetical protein [Actinocorallia aurantiaca]|uniref:Uncharacterized protein n=1 Tax=Actinocorallia aurantiaca TaxID=46204 RepID=A0ABN3UGK8_9ACTN
MHDLLSRDEGIALLVSAVIFLFIGPTVIVALRRGEELSYFVLLNALAFIMPVALLALWPAAFLWPKREDELEKPLTRAPRPATPPNHLGGGVKLIRSRQLSD